MLFSLHKRALAAFVAALVLSLFACPVRAADQPATGPAQRKVRAVIVTGGHGFDEKHFATLFGADNLECTPCVLKDDSEIFEDISNFPYDVIVFFNMTQRISPRRQANFLALLDRGVGVVALHHSVANYLEWPEYQKIIGTRYFLGPMKVNGVDQPVGAYHEGVDYTIRIADPSHPITAGLKDFKVNDEVYRNQVMEDGRHVLLTVDHPESTKDVAWTREYRNSRVVFIQPGHGPTIYADPNYRAIVQRSIAWAARPTRILLQTGFEYPGHPWKETAPALAAAIAKDPRMVVQVCEKPEYLAEGKLDGFDGLVLNYMNWESPDPGPKARENLKAFVEGGKGLVLYHFACGAFQGWPEFASIAGRAWDPKLRPHDPLGPFTVNIVNADHYITGGMKDFSTTDELYTCLAGDAPISVLAQATSKVDNKVYPMAFTCQYGKGRTFHCVLGHDLKAFNEPVQELYRRGAAWAAGIEK